MTDCICFVELKDVVFNSYSCTMTLTDVILFLILWFYYSQRLLNFLAIQLLTLSIAEEGSRVVVGKIDLNELSFVARCNFRVTFPITSIISPRVVRTDEMKYNKYHTVETVPKSNRKITETPCRYHYRTKYTVHFPGFVQTLQSKVAELN